MRSNIFLCGVVGFIVVLGLAVGSANAKLSKSAYQIYQQANMAECKGDIQGAVDLINKAISTNSEEDVMLYTKLGGLYVTLEKYDEALEIYKKAVALRYTDAFLYVSLGNIYQVKGDNINALVSYQKALELCPEYKYNYLNVANVELALKHYSEAEDNYKKFLESYPENYDAIANFVVILLINVSQIPPP